MNGNFGRAYSSGTTAPLHQQQRQQHPASGNGYILTGRGYRHIGPCGSRSFSTSKHGRCRPSTTAAATEQQPTISTSTMPTTEGYAPHPHNSYQANPGGFLNGIKNIVNGFINPTLNTDFYWDHSRHYNPKYRNNYMMDHRQQESSPAKPAGRCNASSLKTVFFGLGSNPTRSSDVPTPHTNGSADSEIDFTIFTSEDFPALPAIKKSTPAPTIPASSTSATKPTAKSVPMRCQQQAKPPPVTETNFASNAAAAASHDKDITCDFVLLDNPKPKICNPVAATTNACRSAAIGLSAIRCRPRIRQISECSDDSFVICFSDDAPEGVLEVARDSDSDDDSDFDVDSGDSDEDDDDDDDIDETDNHVRNRSETSQPDSGFDDGKDKRVRFNLNPHIHMMYKWDFAYRAARKGHWENFARDRQRFKNRIDILSKIISPILDTQHREKIYRMRFCDSENNATSD